MTGDSSVEESDVADTTISEQAALPTGSERILLVDTDVERRHGISVVLRGLGYAVTDGSDGRWGFSRLLVDNPDLLLTSALIPDFSGVDLADVATKVRPSARIIMLLDDDPRSRILLHDVPASLETVPAGTELIEIAEIVRRVLDRD